jgi:cation diffusion facilitator CzcD-associated flavoprotein CzcO
MSGLDDLRARIKHDLAILGIDRATWVPRQDGLYDVLIVGGGQSGLGAAFALLREKVSNVLVLDENPAGEEGPWMTYARMITLRTPKDLLSIDLGIPSLTFRAFWEAQHGAEGWEALGKIPRADWMAYLRFYREVLGLPVQNETRVLKVGPLKDGAHDVMVKSPAGESVLRAKKVVLATGIQGGGEWHTPDMIKVLPRSRYAHTSETIDFDALKGKRIAVLGAGASAFDNAQFALNEGVAEAHVFVRRNKLPQINPIRFMERTGVIPRFAGFTDAEKYDAISYFLNVNQPPTNDTFQRAAAWPGFKLHLGAPWEAVRETPEGVEVTTPKGKFVFDFLILSTGLVTDPALRAELKGLAPKIACWRDRLPKLEGPRHPLVDAHPYLGTGFEFTPKDPADAQALSGLYSFNYSALVSIGLSASAISGLRYALPRLAGAIADDLFRDNKAQWLSDYRAYDEPEFVSEWIPKEAAQ